MTTIQKIILAATIVLALLLRSINLSTNPPGLYWDEAAFGYDAYSILKTGHDHHGHFMPILFESFGDWKLPGYFYLLVPSIAIFGLNEVAVRAPSVFLGTLTVLVFFFLVRKLTANVNVALLSALFLAISPWHIQFSRGGFESIPALFFVTLATFLFVKFEEVKKSHLLSISLILFVLSMYTYHAYRIFTPLLCFSLFIFYFKKIKTFSFKTIAIPIFLALILFAPLLFLTFSAKGSSRALSQSAFKSNEKETLRLDFDQKSKKPLRFLSAYIYQPELFYSQIVIKNYFNHFSPDFLFVRGDQIGRHSQVDLGQIYSFEAILLIASVFAIYKFKKINYKIMAVWLLLAPIPAVIVLPTPHAYRTLQMSVPLAFFSGLGTYYLVTRKNKTLILAISAAALVSFFIYLHHLFFHYPIKFADDWQNGYKQTVQQVLKVQNFYDKIYVTNINQVPYIYFLFYGKYDPQKFVLEQGSGSSFNKYYFVDTTKTDFSDKGRILLVAPSWQKVDGIWISAVNQVNGKHLYSLWEVNEK